VRKIMAITLIVLMVLATFSIGSGSVAAAKYQEKPHTKLVRKDPGDGWSEVKGKPWGDYHTEDLCGEFRARVHIVGGEPLGWYLITLYSEDEETGEKLGSVGYYGEVEKDCWADIGLVQVSESGEGTFRVPCDGPVDPGFGSLEAPLMPLGKYKDVSIHVKYVGTGSTPDWFGLMLTGGYTTDEGIKDYNLYSRESISFDVWDKLILVEKNPSTWEVVEGGASGTLCFDIVDDEFTFKFSACGLEPYTEYSLIYYADKYNRFVNWGGDNPGAHIMTGSTGEGDCISLSGTVELGMDLPHPDDFNYGQGAKIWLVLADDYDPDAKKLTAWHPTEYLFETNLIHYDDSGVITVDVGNTGSEGQEAICKFGGWGPIEPATHGGNWGGFGTTGKDCRVLWASSEIGGEGWIPDDAAVIKISTSSFGSGGQDVDIEIKVLDGIADDSFTIYEVEENGGYSWTGNQLYTYDYDTSTAEYWVTHTFSLTLDSDVLFLLIQADGSKWGGWGTYGQVGVDWIIATSA
jgi:hypothetical protein